ncbi:MULTISPECIES: type II toxin-antitoxin system VapC family toxin [Pyrobaculum]|uniref:Ribonuclease VapC n=1 Tax=Pyrobaculum ferrireducens TaxID=1104324 RepID=G7VGM5_9CREN|nr:type II toxin-antitoxin system VapC family toxin [Pyrobaculum ferrireducens]AET33125.1 PilT protein domain protein [Pyrobaculum ferrireducens]
MSRKWIYIDVNVLYYFFTAHPKYGEGSRELIKNYAGRLATSALTAWLLYVLTRNEEVVEAVRDLTTLLPLDAEVLNRARSLAKPRDFEDRIHLATMQIYGIDTILSNDGDFDNAGVHRIPPRAK